MEYREVYKESVDNKIANDRAKQINFIEIEIQNDSVNEQLAEMFIKEIISYNLKIDLDKESWKDIKEIIADKIELIDNVRSGFYKNDGTIIPLIANYILSRYFNIELLSYLQDLEELEGAPNGFDAIFLAKNTEIFLCEYKSSISQLDENKLAKVTIEGYKSIFCKKSKVIARIGLTRERIKYKKKIEKKKIVENLSLIRKNRRDLTKLTQNKKDILFNICCVTKYSDMINYDKLYNEINNAFIKEKFCKKDASNDCSYIKTCDKHERIKVINIINIKLPQKFDIKNFYNKIIEYIEREYL